jgi:hypothetical protein
MLVKLYCQHAPFQGGSADAEALLHSVTAGYELLLGILPHLDCSSSKYLAALISSRAQGLNIFRKKLAQD